VGDLISPEILLRGCLLRRRRSFPSRICLASAHLQMNYVLFIDNVFLSSEQFSISHDERRCDPSSIETVTSPSSRLKSWKFVNIRGLLSSIPTTRLSALINCFNFQPGIPSYANKRELTPGPPLHSVLDCRLPFSRNLEFGRLTSSHLQ
jgi:hypothetical protein